MFKNIPLLLLCCCLSQVLLAQDPHYSFMLGNVLGTNPALTGQTSRYHSRLQLSYRNQWSTVLKEGAFQTAFVGYDRRVCIDAFRNVFVGFGASVIGDTRGDNKVQRFDALGSAALIVRLDAGRYHDMYLSAGGEAGWIGHRLGFGELTFDDQFDTPGIEPEISMLASSNVADLGAGAALSIAATEKDRGVDLQAGVAIKHITKPPLTYFELSDDLVTRLEHHLIYHLGFSWNMNKRIRLPVQVVYRVQQPHRQLLTSIGFRYRASDQTDLQLASGLRLSRSIDGYNQDALVPRISVFHDRYQVTASYDVNLSGLRRASAYVGSLELMMSYHFGNDKCEVVFCDFF